MLRVTTIGSFRPTCTSANAPAVSILSPGAGQVWFANGAYTVVWSAGDMDSDSLTYSVLYSHNGADWTPVGTAITSSQLTVNAAELAGGNSARIGMCQPFETTGLRI